MESLQSKLGYAFIHNKHLRNALVAAHRSEKDGVASDGNRGMARIGQIAVEMVETFRAVVVEKAYLSKYRSTKTDEYILIHAAEINRRPYWWKDKKKVATACKVLDIEPHIVRSTRQTGQELSVEVLNFALNAVIGAVWLDCQDQNRTINDLCNTVSRILGRIDSFLDSPTAVSCDQNVSPIAENSAPVFPTGQVTHETPGVNLGSDSDMTDASASLETYEDFSVFPLLSVSEEHNDLMTEHLSPQWFFLEQQPLPEYDAADSLSQNHDQGSITGSLSAGTQDVGAQAVFSIERGAVIEPMTVNTADSSIPVATTSKRALAGQESGGSLGAQRTGSLQRKNKRAQTEGDKVHATLESLLDAERQKIGAYSQPERTWLLRYLEYPQTTQLKSSFHLFKFLYLAIGSWDTLADFASQVQSVGETRRSLSLPSPFCSAASIAFNMMCQLDKERSTCILLKRYYAVQFLEDGQQSSQPRERMQVETPQTFGLGNTSQRGNPQVRQEAAEIRFLTAKVVPDLEDTSREYLVVYDKVKRFRQLGKRLQVLTKPFGIGVLALLPSGPSFPGFSLTDRM